MQWEEYNYWIANINMIGNKKIEALLGYFGSAKEVYHTSATDLIQWVIEMESYGRGRITEGDMNRIINSRNSDRIQREYQAMVQKGIRFITIESSLYPPKLKAIYDAPYALYVKGRVPGEEWNPNNKHLAMIGAREYTPYGREMAESFARNIAAMGIPIISGLARGIDTFAHWGAIKGEGITYAVLGCGVDICYPKENIQLYMDILEKYGGIISEFPPGTKPFPNNFPMRNRIISGLSDGILVIEAKEKSGSLITVDMGLDQGKEIYAIPGKISDRCSMGCNNLIRMGAKLVTSSEDILEDLIDHYHKYREEIQVARNLIHAVTCKDMQNDKELSGEKDYSDEQSNVKQNKEKRNNKEQYSEEQNNEEQNNEEQNNRMQSNEEQNSKEQNNKEHNNQKLNNKDTKNKEMSSNDKNNDMQNIMTGKVIKHNDNRSNKTHSISRCDRYENVIMSHMDYEPKHLDQLVAVTKLPLDILLEQLLFLELNGFIRQTMKNYYILKAR